MLRFPRPRAPLFPPPRSAPSPVRRPPPSCRPGPAGVCSPVAVGSGRTSHKKQNDATKLTVSRPYTNCGPGPAARTPPSAAPAMTLTFIDIDIKAPAATSWSRGTTLGTDASRDGRCNAAEAIISPATTYSSQTMGRAASAFSIKSAAQTPSVASHQTISLRRSKRSASTPPYRPNTTSGTTSTAPSRPTAKVEPVSWRACTSRATSVAWVPRPVMVRLVYSSRKSRDSRSGVTSARSGDLLIGVSWGGIAGVSADAGRRLGTMSEGSGSSAASSHLPVARSGEFDPRPGPARSGGSPAQGAAIAGGRHWHAVTVTRQAPGGPLGFLSAPDVPGDLDDQFELGDLLVVAQHVPLDGGGEAALRRQAQLVERHELRRLIDAALEHVRVFQLAPLGGHQAEHDHLARRHEAQRLEAAGTVVVVLEEEPVHVQLAEQCLGNEVIPAGRGPGGPEVAPAHVGRDRHLCGLGGERVVDLPDVAQVQVVGVLTARGDLGPLRRVVQVGQAGVVELQVGAAQGGQPGDFVGVGGGQVAPELLDVRVDLGIDRGGPAAVVDHVRRRDGQLRGRGARQRLQVGEVLFEDGLGHVDLGAHMQGGRGELDVAGRVVEPHRQVAGRLADPADLIDEVHMPG